MASKEFQLMAHLMRRAGFGASREELYALVEQGYEATVESVLETDHPNEMSQDLMRRYHPESSGMMGPTGGSEPWMYRMISTDAPLREKIALFWHGIFATGYSKLCSGKPLDDQIRTFLRHGLGSFRGLLLEMSRDPAMIVWLDNYDNHNGAINENYARELLELFSMGTGNYSEHDIAEAARAFTGWTIGSTKYQVIRAMVDQDRPYGRVAIHFEYRPEDHDDGEKEFLGRRCRFNGEDIVDIVCEQQATARFISRYLYSFFVADEPPVPEWPYKPPRDPEAIATLSRTYFESGYNIREMLRVLFKSQFFKSEEVRYERVKGPAELMAGVLRLTEEFKGPHPRFPSTNQQTTFMGQTLLNPDSVEGWHWGTEWVNSGTLVERVNFASERLGNLESPGVLAMVDRILAGGNGGASPGALVDKALDQLVMTEVSAETRSALIEFAEKQDELAGDGSRSPRERAVSILKMIGATPEFQRA